jgi:hypothetical protein
MDAKNTEDTENNKPSHLDEYKALHDEVTMCQHEMHRTWLWASIAAGAVYTWLPSHRSDINNIHLSLLGWSIPPLLLIFCFFRYGVFWFRIRSLVDYQCRIEKHAFIEEKQLPGIARYNRECLDKNIFDSGAGAFPLPERFMKMLPGWIKQWLPSTRHFFTWVAFILWSALIVSSILLSWSLSRTKSDDSLYGQVIDSVTRLPIVGATVAVTDSSKNPHTVTTDAAGHYGVSSLPTGPARVTAKKTGYDRASSERTIAPGTNTQDEVLVPKKSP